MDYHLENNFSDIGEHVPMHISTFSGLDNVLWLSKVLLFGEA